MCPTLWQGPAHVGEGPTDSPAREEEEVTDQTHQHRPSVTAGSVASRVLLLRQSLRRERLPPAHGGRLLGAIGVLGLVMSQFCRASGC